MSEKTVTARIPEELHVELRIKLAQEGLTYQGWVTEQIKKYVAEKRG